jgi:hypothetical protein
MIVGVESIIAYMAQSVWKMVMSLPVIVVKPRKILVPTLENIVSMRLRCTVRGLDKEATPSVPIMEVAKEK